MRRANPIWVILLLLSATIIGGISSIPPAHALPSIVQASYTNAASASNLGTPFGSPPTSGNVLVAAVGEKGDTSLCATRGSVTVTDTLGTTYSLLASQPCILNGTHQSSHSTDFSSEIFVGKAPSTGADSVTFTAAAGSAAHNTNIDMAIYEISGSSTTVEATAKTNTTVPCTVGTPTICKPVNILPAIAFSSNDVIINMAEIYWQAAAAQWFAGTSFTLPGGCCSGSASSGASEYQVVSTDGTTNNTYAHFNAGNNVNFGGSTGYVESALILGPGQVTVSTVVACTFFQLQCWWYPMFFFAIYTGIFGLVGFGGKVGGKGATYLMMAGLTFAAMLEVIMGMLNVMFPILLTALTVIYAIRVR